MRQKTTHCCISQHRQVQNTLSKEEKPITATILSDTKITLASYLPSSSLPHKNSKRHVWLSTAVVKILNHNNEWSTCKILLDSEFQSHFITKALIKKLGLTLRNKVFQHSNCKNQPSS